MVKKALVTGITGQDGSYLAELLIEKGYMVYGFMRRTSTDPFARIEHLYESGKIKLIHGNMRDLPTIRRALEEVRPDEVYNLAAQSHVGVSFECPDETEDVNFKGVERIIAETFRVNPQAHFYQASTSEMFGETPPMQNESSPMKPVSPYAEAKLRAHRLIREYRDRGFFAVSGILFNHESPRRGKHFVTRKLTHSLVKVKLGLQKTVKLGNLNAERDWGFAGDYVEAMWRMMQHNTPDDFVIATGKRHTVRDLAQTVCERLEMPIHFDGNGIHEVGMLKSGEVIIEVQQKYFRPREVAQLCGDASKAREVLRWNPNVDFRELISMMVDSDKRLLSTDMEYYHD